jgi:hypothetical protein
MINVALLDYELRQAGLPVVGVSADGHMDYDRELTAAEQATAAAVIAAHNPAGKLPQEQAAIEAMSGYAYLSDWVKTGTAAQAETYIKGLIWNGADITTVNSYIDNTIKETLIVNITTANVAQINAQLANIRAQLANTRTVFKAAASAIIAMRDLFILCSKLAFYIRDLVIRFRV